MLARSLRNRYPYLDPLHVMQVDLLRRFRAGDHRRARPARDPAHHQRHRHRHSELRLNGARALALPSPACPSTSHTPNRYFPNHRIPSWASTRSPGHTESPRDLVDGGPRRRGARPRRGVHRERFNVKEASTLSGRGRRASTETSASPPRPPTTTPAIRSSPPRSPPRCTASPAAASRSASGAGFDADVRRAAASRAITTAQLEDFAGHDAPALARRDDRRPRRTGRHATRTSGSTRRSTRTSRCCSSPSARTSLELGGRAFDRRSSSTPSSPTRR